MSANNGINWFNKNQGFNSISIIKSILIVNDHIFAGTAGQSVWRRSLADITGINQISLIVPSSYSLSQNYPNPFNPVTNLEFGISDLGFVSLIVYDILGKEVATLVNEKLNPGKYKVEFDGSALPSGVYFYRITAGEFTDTKRMMLIK